MSAPLLSGLTPGIPFIWDLYEETSFGLWEREDKLLDIVKTGQPLGSDFARFTGMSEREIRDFFVKAQDEIEALVVFDLLSAAEGRLRDDFEKRVEDAGDTSPLTHDFRVIAKEAIQNKLYRLRRILVRPLGAAGRAYYQYVSTAATTRADQKTSKMCKLF